MNPAIIKPAIDWQAIELDYRAGVLSYTEIGALHGVSKGRISQVAKAKGWEQDLKAKIHAKAEAKLNAAAVNSTLNSFNEVSQRQIIEAGSDRIARVRLEHRKSIARGHALCEALMAELEAQTFDKVLMEQLATLMRKPDDEGHDRLNEIYRKVISMPGRVDTAKKLIETMKSVVSMEREAYGIDALPVANPTDSLTAFLMGMKRSALPVVQEVGRDEHL